MKKKKKIWAFFIPRIFQNMKWYTTNIFRKWIKFSAGKVKIYVAVNIIHDVIITANRFHKLINSFLSMLDTINLLPNDKV